MREYGTGNRMWMGPHRIRTRVHRLTYRGAAGGIQSMGLDRDNDGLADFRGGRG